MAEPVIVVSGLPRSGTSMMMQVLAAAGLPLMIDHRRAPDSNNPRGYYEYTPVKRLHKGDRAWVRKARGRVVKVVSPLLVHLPAGYDYQVVFMRRSLDEVIASQQVMLTHGSLVSAEQYRAHLDEISGWLRDQPRFAVLDVAHRQLIHDPVPVIEALVDFLDLRSPDRAAMQRVIDPALYRQQAP